MNSSAGFENTANSEKSSAPRKKAVSTGLWVVFVFLLLVIGAWLLLEMRNKSLKEDVSSLEAEIIQVNKDINTAMDEKDADFAMRAYTMEKDLYRQYEANDILDIIESIMVVQTTGPDTGDRVVLKSFQYNSGAKTDKTFNDGNATITGAGGVTITADADSFNVMAQQVKAFKEVHYVNEELLAQLKEEEGDKEKANVYYFNNVTVGATDRDDSGRIVFTLTMDTIPFDISPYENIDDEIVIEQPVQETQSVENEQDQADVTVITGEEELIVADDGVEVTTGDETMVIAPDEDAPAEGDVNEMPTNTAPQE